MRGLDWALPVAVRRTGAPWGVRYTERQLYYEVCRAVARVQLAPRRPGFTMPPLVRYPRFLAALDRYRARHGEPLGLLHGQWRAPRPSAGREPDLFGGQACGYGLPALLLCRPLARSSLSLASAIMADSINPW